MHTERVTLSWISLQGEYRTVLFESWVQKLNTYEVPHSTEPTLIGTLGNPVKIRSWQVCTWGEAGPG